MTISDKIPSKEIWGIDIVRLAILAILANIVAIGLSVGGILILDSFVGFTDGIAVFLIGVLLTLISTLGAPISAVWIWERFIGQESNFDDSEIVVFTLVGAIIFGGTILLSFNQTAQFGAQPVAATVFGGTLLSYPTLVTVTSVILEKKTEWF